VLTVIGDLVDDVVVWVDGPVRTGTDNPSTVHRSRGGSGANVAVAAALAAGPGSRVRFIGCVGDDAAGRELAAQLTDSGVDVRVQRRGTTGTVIVVVDATAERTMFPDRAAAGRLGPIDPQWLAGTAVLHVPAYGLLTASAAEAIHAAAAVVRAAGGAVTVDVSATSVIEAIGIAEFGRLMVTLHPALLFANSDEAGVLGLLETAPPSGCTVVVKRGPRPAVLLHADGTTTEVVAETVLDVRDTTGAGDAFAGGFLVSWMGGAAPEEACAAGHRYAAAVLTTPGAR
jgi:sugar/nucleoside kinase (ribokinase family)